MGGALWTVLLLLTYPNGRMLTLVAGTIFIHNVEKGLVTELQSPISFVLSNTDLSQHQLRHEVTENVLTAAVLLNTWLWNAA
jgi:hypothetical protein